MAGGQLEKERTLEETSTWVVAVLCVVLVGISISSSMAFISSIRYIKEKSMMHLRTVRVAKRVHKFCQAAGLLFFRQLLKKKRKVSLAEALEKVKSELMLLGFISLLLTVSQNAISDICEPKKIAASWRPCNKPLSTGKSGRRLLDSWTASSVEASLPKVMTSAPRRGSMHL